MANGYPISALVGRKKIMNMMEEIFVSGTFAGETLSMAASLATISKLKKNNIPSKISKLGQQLITDTNKIIKNIQLDDTFHFSGNNWWPRLEIKKKMFFYYTYSDKKLLEMVCLWGLDLIYAMLIVTLK